MTDRNEKIKNVNTAIKRRTVPHGNFKEALDRGKELFMRPDLGKLAQGIFVYGNAGVGKTELAQALVRHGEKRYGKSAVRYVHLISGATIKNMISGLLREFRDPLYDRGSTEKLADRLSRTIESQECRVIIIDEIQHLIPGGNPSPAKMDNILNALKILNDAGASFVVAGMESSLCLWRYDEQIRSRFQSVHHLKPVSWSEQAREWRGILEKYNETLEDQGINIECESFAKRCYAATQGSFRALELLLMDSATAALQDDRNTITKHDLHTAAKQQVDELDGMSTAFFESSQAVEAFNDTFDREGGVMRVEAGVSDLFRKSVPIE